MMCFADSIETRGKAGRPGTSSPRPSPPTALEEREMLAAHTQVVLPEHKQAVQRFFKREGN
jgi:hypothetical protein